MASWADSPATLAADCLCVGGKAAGLFRLPKSWVPPFLVLTSAFYSFWRSTKDVGRALDALESAEKVLLDEFFDRIVPKHGGASAKIFIRSNSPLENLSVRGAYKSYPIFSSDKDSIADAIEQVLSQGKMNPMCVLLQPAIDPSWTGHMSNERRLSQRKNRWLVEGLIHELRGTEQRYIRAVHPDRSKALLASKESELIAALRRVAGGLLEIGDGRFHCEWVWDGKQVWIVQADEATQQLLGETANKYITATSKSAPRFSPRSCLRHFSDIDPNVWKKLRCPHLFRTVGLPAADIYVLTGEEWHNKDRSHREYLERDLLSMCAYPVVVRCDIASHFEDEHILLPTSPATTDAHELVRFMERVASAFKERGLDDQDWAFLLACLVPARAAAMIHARPKAQRVRIDALWGFPDGLLHFPHDTWYYISSTNKATERRRYKGICLLPGQGKWVPTPVDSPFDWKPVLSKKEVETLAKWALRVANKLDREIELMALSRIGGARGPRACLPWHFTSWSVPRYAQSLPALPRSSEIRVIDSQPTLELLRREGDKMPALGYLVRPIPEQLRDSEFLKEAATHAASQDRPIYFEGSVLGHAYYIMSRTGAAVIPIMEDEPEGERKIYHKLIRDLIPVVIERAGGLKRVRAVPRSHAITLLAHKLIEEAFEFWNCSPTDRVEELADVLEVIEALQGQIGIQPEELERVRREKRAKRGGFDQLLYLEETSIRSLKAESNRDGRLPLRTEDTVLPSRKATKTPDNMILEVKGDPPEHFRFSLPLVPPVYGEGVRKVLRQRVNDFQIEVRYSGNQLIVSVSRLEKDEIGEQLPLFSDLKNGGS